MRKRKQKITSACRWHDHMHRKHSATTKKMVRTNKFSKAAKYKIRTHKSIMFIYTTNHPFYREIK